MYTRIISLITAIIAFIAASLLPVQAYADEEGDVAELEDFVVA